MKKMTEYMLPQTNCGKIEKEDELSVNRTYKARIFEMLFSNKKELLDSCKTLREYSEYTARVRRYAKNMEPEDAVERAITECIEEGILADLPSIHWGRVGDS